MANARSRGGTLGTFGGVFAPSILTILGVVLFLRMGFVIGSGGLAEALGILALATSISVTTSLSLAAIATNRKVRAGGDYFLISRSLGMATGGALGLLLFAAQSLSVAFYCIGFGEGVAAILGSDSAAVVTIAAICSGVALLALAWLGADLATRFQFGIMAILVLALVSFFAGGAPRFDAAQLRANLLPPADGLGFWPLFAIFFPAVTGFTQGVSMSGELRDPGRSLPLGTFLAVGVSTVVYVGVIVVLGGALPVAKLAAETDALRQLSAQSWLVDAGLLSATLSSALASLLGAPRILQALARDGVFSTLGFFAAGHGTTQNPRRAVLLTGAIALATIAVGSLNSIATLVSMFFLISYGLLNYATYVEATAASPSFRPRFRFFHARGSLLGVLLCGAAMLAIDPIAGGIAVAILAAVYQYVQRTAVPARWRDSRQAYRFRQVREGLRELTRSPGQPGEWQPQIIVFTESVTRRARVLRFASWISGGTGLVTAVRVIEAKRAGDETRTRVQQAEEEMREEIEQLGLDAYPLVVAAPDLRDALGMILQSWGTGPIRSNLVVANWLGADANGAKSAALWYGRTLGQALRLRRSVIVLDTDETAWLRMDEMPGVGRRIDVWFFDDESSRLMLLLAYLMTRSESWDEASIRVLVPAVAGNEARAAEAVERRLEEGRIEATVETVVDPDVEAVVSRSRDAAFVFVPLRLPGMRLEDPFGIGIETLLERLPLVALVAAAEDVPIAEEEESEPAGAAPEADEAPSAQPE
ncbi:MAG: amino acid permease [Myxococcota bacterium]